MNRELENRLESLVDTYGFNKAEMDSLKKTVDSCNKDIKKILTNEDLDTYSSGNFKVTKSVSNRETLNEAKLLEICKKNNLDSVVKTKEYIDMDTLEDAIYNGLVPNDVLVEMDGARTVKEVVTLRVSKVKKEA